MADQSPSPAQKAVSCELLQRTSNCRRVDGGASGDSCMRWIQPTVIAKHVTEDAADIRSGNRKSTWPTLKLQPRLPLGSLLAIEPYARTVAEDRVAPPLVG